MPQESKMTPERWRALMGAWGFGENRATLDALLSAYSESGRYYHTKDHVSACLRHLDTYLTRINSPREVEIALWFHDAIYKPFSGTNEKDSADWAVSFLSDCGAVQEESTRVRQLIMVTEHNAPSKTKDEAVLVDIDLSILGTNPSTYDEFERAVRKEYRLVPSFIFKKKRAAVLKGILQRPRIYTAGLFPEAVELQAKENLSNAVSKLEER